MRSVVIVLNEHGLKSTTVIFTSYDLFKCTVDAVLSLEEIRSFLSFSDYSWVVKSSPIMNHHKNNLILTSNLLSYNLF